MVKFTEKAAAKVRQYVENSTKAGVALRISAEGKEGAPLNYEFLLDDYDNQRPDDFQIREGGFLTRVDGVSARWIRGATVDWVEKEGGEGFALSNLPTPGGSDEIESMKEIVVGVLKTIYDPEIPVNIYDLGLIYGVDINAEREVTVRMTLTAPNCPAAEILPKQVKEGVGLVPGVTKSDVELTWEPPWHPGLMSEAARLDLNM